MGADPSPQLILQTDHGRLLHGDGVAWLEACPPGSIDLVVADPPYAMGKAAWDRFPSLAAYLE